MTEAFRKRVKRTARKVIKVEKELRKPAMGQGIKRARFIAISLIALSFVLLLCTASFAGEKAGTVTHLSGPLFAKKADGKTRALSVNSIVEQGDILVTGKKTHARIRFLDNAEMTLRPNSQMKISKFYFEQTAPQKDAAFFDLVKGGARSVVGLIGRRGSQNSYRMVTENATAGVRGTIYDCRVCKGDCGSLPDGTYFFVVEGTIAVSNEAGSQDVGAGQYAYVRNTATPPVILPENPGLDFSLPSSIGGPAGSGDPGGAGGGCTVR